MLFELILLIVGFIVLLSGAYFLVDGACSIAKKFNVPDIIVGLTIIGFGTSAPELVINLISNLESHDQIGVGNIIGSDVSNLTFILGVAALISSFRIKKEVFTKEYLYSLFAVFITIVLIILGGFSISILSGLILLSFFVVYLVHVYYFTTNHAHIKKLASLKRVKSLAISTGMVLMGVILLWLGAQFVIDNSVYIARSLNVSEILISSIVVSFGTTLPELFSAIIASIKKKKDLVIGNAFGTIVFNTTFIYGLSSLFNPITIDKKYFDLFFILFFILIVFIVVVLSFKKFVVGKKEGIILLITYIGYIFYLVLKESVIF